MIGFGFMDNTIMIHAGHYVDCTLGVTFGLSTLAAAGIGQIFSGIGGVMFGDALEAVFQRMSGAVNGSGVAASSTMSKAQRTMRVSRMAGLMGGIFGVALGCTLGLVNLFF
ncbi:GAF domain-containing protein, partial [Thalassiosira pseudonana CCMP1335]